MQRTEYAFHYKYSYRADGTGLESDPILVRVANHFDVSAGAVGTGSLRLQSTSHDPYGEIEVIRVRHGFYLRADIRAHAEVVGTVPAADFLPWAFAKTEDWARLGSP